MRNLIIVLILITYSISYSQKVWEKEGWALTARNLNHEGVKNKSKSDLSQLFEQYLNKASNQKELDELKNDYPQNPVVWIKHVCHLYKNLININKVKEFKEIGIDLNNKGYNDIKSKSVFSQIIFSGVVIESNETDLGKKKSFEVRVIEILKGNYYLKKYHDDFNLSYYVFNDELDMYYGGKYRTLYKPIEINQQYLFFIDKISWEADNFEGYYKENEANLDHDKILYYSIDQHHSPDSVKYNDLIKYSPPINRPPRVNFREKIYINELDTLKSFLKKYEEINDTPNFFSRSYK